MVNHLLLVEHVDIMIGALIGFIVLLQLPRALARLWGKSERYNGHFIWCNARKLPGFPWTISKEPAFAIGRRPVDHEETLRSSYPPHIPAYPAFLRPLTGPLRRSIAFGYSSLQILIMLAYLAIMLYTFSYQSDFLNTPIRSAYIAAAQLPFLYAFAAKNGIPGLLLGMGYQSLNFIHRSIGCIVVLASNVHAIGLFYQWTNNHTIRSEFQRHSNWWGLVVLIFVDIIFVFSTSYWRRRAYNIFWFTHVVGYLFIIPALYFHEPTSLPFIVAASIIYLLDRALRLLKTRLATATVRPLPALEATRIEIPSLNCGWRAGQHVRLRVLSMSFGWLGWMELHPFTIASAPASNIAGDEGLVLICKKTGRWTSKLFDMAKAFRSTESGIEAEMNIEKSVNVLIEGPYGGPGHTIFASYSAVFLVTGGSGITFALSAIQELVQKGLRGESSLKVIELVWISQYPDAITPLLPVFASLANSCSYLTIYMHYTRSQTAPSEVKSELSGLLSSHEQSRVFPSGLTVHLGRPGQGRLTSMMESAITRATDDSDPNGTISQRGLLVGICGPRGMRQSVCTAVADIDQKMVIRVGGVEVHQECFEF